MSKIEYSQLDPKEVESFYTFYKNFVFKFFYPEYSKKTLEYFCTAEKEFNPKTICEYAKSGNVLVAKSGEEFAGSLMFDNPDGGVSFTRWIAVDDKFQNKGIATKLLKLYEVEAIKRGVHCLMLCTEERNLSFYKNRGFTYMGLNPVGYYGAPDHWFYKQIQEAKEKNYLK